MRKGQYASTGIPPKHGACEEMQAGTITCLCVCFPERSCSFVPVSCLACLRDGNTVKARDVARAPHPQEARFGVAGHVLLQLLLDTQVCNGVQAAKWHLVLRRVGGESWVVLSEVHRKTSAAYWAEGYIADATLLQVVGHSATRSHLFSVRMYSPVPFLIAGTYVCDFF